MQQTTADGIINTDRPSTPPDESETNLNTSTFQYEYPRINFNREWKNRGCAIIFWIHTIAVILIGSILGISAVSTYAKNNKYFMFEEMSFNHFIKTALFGFFSLMIATVLPVIIIFILLQSCAGQLIKCSFLMIIMIQVIPTIIIAFEFWPLCFVPLGFLTLTLFYLVWVRKLIFFAEVHLQTGCAAVRSHPSLKLIAIVLLMVEILWFVFWFLMVIGIDHYFFYSTSNKTINTNRDINTINEFYMAQIDDDSKHIDQSSQTSKNLYIRIFILLLSSISWLWGTLTFGNIAHFLTVCTIGRWWFPNEYGQQYSIRNSIERVFTTDFGTVCYGSFFKALVKPRLSSNVENNHLKRCFIHFISSIWRTVENVVAGINEWTFIYSALTGQESFLASQSFTDLFQRRGWTVIINDNLIENSFMISNIGTGIVAATTSGFIAQLLLFHGRQATEYIIIVLAISFLIGLLMSAIMTKIFLFSVRTIFICFALNPEALGVTHPDYLIQLTKAWHKFHPKEFENSGYANKFMETTA